MRLLAVIPCWGAGYVDRLLRYTLPSLRSPGNLPTLAARFEDFRCVIYTKASEASQVACGLPDDGPFEVQVLDDGSFGGHPGTAMKQLFQRGFDLAWAEGAAFAPICADAVYVDGLYASAASLLLDEGKSAAMTQGAAADVSVIGPWIDGAVVDGRLAWTTREAMFAFMHQGGRLPTWPGTRRYPAQVFFPFAGGAVMRCAHMYTVMIKPDRHAVMAYSHDNDLAEKVLTDPAQIGWLEDSDDGFFFGLAEPASACLADAAPPGDGALETFCRTWLSPWKAGYYDRRIVWHEDEVDLTALAPALALAASDVVVAEILDAYRRVAA